MRRRGFDIDGVLVIDKPEGITSAEVVRRVKRIFFAKKVGHTGTLDPLATGVLPLCLGKATKLAQTMLITSKRYRVGIRLGITTDTGDSYGNAIKECSMHDFSIDSLSIDEFLQSRVGEQLQIPPMYSAVKSNGVPLYKLARQGLTVEREPRKISVYDALLLSFADGVCEVEWHCSKGTYVRVLAEELGEALGCGAHVVSLRRLQSGNFKIDDALRLDDLEKEALHKDREQLLHHLLTLEDARGIIAENYSKNG